MFKILYIIIFWLITSFSVCVTGNVFQYNIMSTPFSTLRVNNNPLIIKSFDDNATIWFSVNQLFNQTTSTDKTKSFNDRCFIAFGHYYIALFSEYISHEVAHEYQDKKFGNTHPISLDFSRWWLPFIPMYNQENIYDYGGITSYFNNSYPITKYHRTADGLNQNEYNAEYFYKKNDRPYITLHESFAYLTNKLVGIEYAIVEKFTPTAIRNNYDLSQVVHVVWAYSYNVNISEEQLVSQMLLSNLFSARVYDSFACIGQYLVTGEDTYPITTTETPIGNILLPNIAYYIMPRGGFYNLTFIVNPYTTNRWDLNLGFDADFLGGEVNALRYGAKLYNIQGLNLYGYLNHARNNLTINGCSIGLEKQINMDPFYLTIQLEYNNNDLIENTVKGKYNKQDNLDKELYGERDQIDATITIGWLL